ncbi:Helicase SEN1 [Wickerhamiella sorbophila]|uniref:Helicase SEN1 n=1 Tax=Wickerhamiella sorbophila TaxID=45607 RepID=A0A2T0FI93_9ASCO|nr:Helicase SEN1 [Wickerhamiella sorbophila]PRT54669.1 Helicase SEN1 [Wickerhamiella sorbophila]
MCSEKKTELDLTRDKWKNDTRSGEAFQNYGDAAACYLVSPLFRNTTAHWFCDPKNFEYATVSLLIFTYIENGDRRIGELKSTYKSLLTSQLSSCWKCVLKYHESRHKFVNTLRGFHLEENRMKSFLGILDTFDLERIQKLTSNPGTTACIADESDDLISISEALLILDKIGIESNERLENELVQKISKNLDEIIALTGRYLLPGLIYLLFSDNASVQSKFEAALFSEEYRPALGRCWGEDQSRALINIFEKKASLVNDNDFSWFLLSQLVKSVQFDQFDEVTLGKLYELTSRETSHSIGPGFFLWLSKLSLRRRRLPEIAMVTQILKKIGLAIENGLKPASTPESAHLHTVYSTLGDKAWQSWIDNFEEIVTTFPESQHNQESVKSFVDWGLNFSANKKINLAILNVVTASLTVPFKQQSFVTYARDISLRMGLFNLLTERTDSFVEAIRRVTLGTDQNALSVLASTMKSLVQYTVLAILSKSPDFTMDSNINRSKKLPWELIFADKNLIEMRESFAQAVIAGASFSPYLDQRCATYKAISEVYRTTGVLCTRDVLLRIFEDADAETALLLACLGLDNDLAETARNIFARLYADEENSFDLAITRYFEINPKRAVAVIVKISDSTLSLGEFQILPGLVKLFKLVFDVLYDSEEGVIDDVNQKLNAVSSPILELWNVTWKTMTVSFGSLRSWSKSAAFSISVLREYISDSLELCLALLNYFTRVEATMPAATNGLNHGNELVEEPVKTLESMVPLLKLRDESQLDSSFRIYKGLIELINKYAVKVPLSLLDYFKALSQSQTLLTTDKYAELLAITGAFSNEEMSNLVRNLESTSTKASSTPANVTHQTGSALSDNTAVIQPRISESSRHSTTRQRTMDSFFTKTPRLPQTNPSRLTAQGVTPSAPKELSAMEQIRLQLASQQAHLSGPVARKPSQVPKEIHPARPAGFNRKKQDEPSEIRANQRLAPEIIKQHELKGRDSSGEGEDEDHDEDEDEDDDEAGVLVALGRKTRNINNLSRVAPGLANRSQRAPALSESEQGVRRMMARLSISPTDLHKAILSWDYFLNSPLPTGFIKQTVSVPNVFKDVEEYTKVMEPLLHLEAWQSIQRAREENEDAVLKLEIGKRVNTDDFIDVYASMEAKDTNGSTVGDSDLVLIAYDQNANGAVKPRIAKEMMHCLAIVKEGSLKTRRGQRYTDLQLRTYHPGELSAFMAQGRKLLMQRVCSVITVEREYNALKALPYYELKDSVLQGKANRPVSQVATQSGDIDAKVQGLNTSQVQAIETALANQGFSLIQGPPGTGKTKTILGIVGKYFSGISGSQKKRLLICAPSNAAVDEIVLRLKLGITLGTGQKFLPKIVRLGRKEVINPEVREFSLEMLVEKSMYSIASAPDEELKSKLTSLTTERTELEEKLKCRDNDGLDQDAVVKLHDKLEQCGRTIQEYSRLLSQQRRQLKEERIRKEAEYKRLQSEYLTNAQVICCTLSGAAHSMLYSLQMTFPTVIIDEAAQSVELSALIPLKYGCKQCIMVGDPHQLPPTVLSQEAARLKYEQSMFVRFYERSPESMTLLDTQFRMHPMISRFPSHEFYKGQLKDGDDMALKTSRPWHENDILSPFRFIEVSHGTEERPGTMSLRNRAEAEVVVQMISYLMRCCPKIDFTSKIGVIAPYKAQQTYISRLIRDRFGAKIAGRIDIATVDGYQGQEKEIIIMSCVRAQKDKDGIGFLADVRRMNVAFTRAQASLWIVGNKESLVKNKVWARLIDYAQYIGMFSKFNHREKDFGRAIKLMPPRLELAAKNTWLRSVQFNSQKSRSEEEPPKKRIKMSNKQHSVSETRRNKTSEGYKRLHSPTESPSQTFNDTEPGEQKPASTKEHDSAKAQEKSHYDSGPWPEQDAVRATNNNRGNVGAQYLTANSNSLPEQMHVNGRENQKYANEGSTGRHDPEYAHQKTNQLGCPDRDRSPRASQRGSSTPCGGQGRDDLYQPLRRPNKSSKEDSSKDIVQDYVVKDSSHTDHESHQLAKEGHAVRASKQRSFDATARAGHERRRKPQLFVPSKRKFENNKR